MAKGKATAKAPAKVEARGKPAAKPQPAKAASGKDSKKPQPVKPAMKGSAKPVATPKPLAAKTQPVKAPPPKASVKPAAVKETPPKGGSEKTGTVKTQPAKVETAREGRTDNKGLRRDGMAKSDATAKRKSAPEATDGPLLDMNDATVKKFIKSAKARGFVTYDELNKVLPSDQNSSEQIEDIMSQLSEMGINVVESEDDVEDSEREQEAGEGRDGHGRPD